MATPRDGTHSAAPAHATEPTGGERGEGRSRHDDPRPMWWPETKRLLQSRLNHSSAKCPERGRREHDDCKAGLYNGSLIGVASGHRARHRCPRSGNMPNTTPIFTRQHKSESARCTTPENDKSSAKSCRMSRCTQRRPEPSMGGAPSNNYGPEGCNVRILLLFPQPLRARHRSPTGQAFVATTLDVGACARKRERARALCARRLCCRRCARRTRTRWDGMVRGRPENATIQSKTSNPASFLHLTSSPLPTPRRSSTTSHNFVTPCIATMHATTVKRASGPAHVGRPGKR